jgi:hypothetical protein
MDRHAAKLLSIDFNQLLINPTNPENEPSCFDHNLGSSFSAASDQSVRSFELLFISSNRHPTLMLKVLLASIAHSGFFFHGPLK